MSLIVTRFVREIALNATQQFRFRVNTLKQQYIENTGSLSYESWANAGTARPTGS